MSTVTPTRTSTEAGTGTDAAAAEWPVWSTTARLVVTDPSTRDAARTLVEAQLAAVDAAASRFRPDSEVSRLHLAGGRPQSISPLLATLVGTALAAARRTGGDVDPTMGSAMVALGYDRNLSELPQATAPARPGRVRVARRPAPGWQRVRLDGTTLTVPADVVLDLGATAKAEAADLCAALVADRLGTGVLVSLGGDIATAGAAPEGGWPVLVRDLPGDPAVTVSLPAGSAVATSSTRSRRWVQDGRLLHHVLDPRTSAPVDDVWRTVTVAAWACVDANTLTTAALVRGPRALPWLLGLDVPARLVSAGGHVATTPRWPAEDPR